jgi:hypothetical protein
VTAHRPLAIPASLDARRYAWCRSQAVWSFGALLPMLAEDVEGADKTRQPGLLLYVSRLVTEYCAIAVYLVEAYPRPLPPTGVRAVVALRSVQDPALRSVLADLLCDSGTDPHVLADRCLRAIARTIEIIGPVPELIDQEQRHRALGQARDWLSLISLVGEGEGDYLPRLPGRTPGANGTSDGEAASGSPGIDGLSATVGEDKAPT